MSDADSTARPDARSDTGARASWPQVTNRPDFPAIEEQVLARWEKDDVFHRSLARNAGGPVFSFYEGPPTANGRPGTHHIEARVFKDIFCRFRAQKGYDVPRKAGWDCHGLPVELEVERELGLNSKADIEAYGIEAFNARCRESVGRYVGEFERLTERIGFWVDMGDAYRTMDATYIDSLWWALKELWDQGLIFQDHRVTPYCARCGTGLSDAEVAMGYETVEDPSVFVRFPLLDGELGGRGASLVVWTTTPWTLPSNTAVAVGRDIAYELVDHDGDLLVIAADLREPVLGAAATVVRPVEVDELLGLHYEAPFTLVEPDVDHRYVVEADFVTTSDGSGLVHMAPAFGADDMEVGRREGLPVVNPVDAAGRFTTGPWAGRFVKDADPDIIAALRDRGVLIDAGVYEHTYPFCWRCKTPLIYWAKPSWYIRTTARREELLANNAEIDWHPEHIRDGRFGNWLENNIDWSLSRDRYWGTPLPFWRCGDCDEVAVVGSRAELAELAGRDLSDLDPHRPYVDEVTVACPACGGEARRVEEVADAWFDSGGMPFAQFGYPHRGREEFERRFPADYICEAIDQTRGWFYSLLAEATLLFDTSSYRTVLCLGHIVDEDGRKMSKSLGNILDPWELIADHGADAIRWLMFAEGNPWVSRRVGPHLVEDVVRQFLLTLWHTHAFFTTYARIDGFSLDDEPPAVPDRPAADRWLLAELAATVQIVDEALDRYDVSRATRRLERFVDDLSNWYVRRNRRRFWRAAGENPADKASAYHTLHTALTTVAQLLAPLTPFVADRLWADLVVTHDADAPDSVHLADFPVVPDAWVDQELRDAMAAVRRVVELGRAARNDSGVKVRQPLPRALVTVPARERDAVRLLADEIADELNVKEVALSDGADELVERSLRPNFRALGPAFQKEAPKVGAALREAERDTADRIAGELERAGVSVLTVGDRGVELTPEMVEVVETPRTGWALASEGGRSFALDTSVTEELRVEGAARELIRALNDQRKALDLALDERIEVAVHAMPPDLDLQLADGGWYDVVAAEVLADHVHRRPHPEAETVDLGDLGSVHVAVLTGGSPGQHEV